MTSMALKITGFLALMVLTGGNSQPQVLDPQNPSKNILTTLLLFNGYFSNIRMVQNEESHHSRDHEDMVNMTQIPVEVPAFLPYPVIYAEESVNSVIYRRQVWVLSEFDDGIINIQQFNLTDPSENIPQIFDISTLADLVRDDFQNSPEDCDLTFNLVEDNVIIGSAPDCNNRYENGQRPAYAMTVTCNAFSVVNTNPISLEAASRSVYPHYRYGSRFPYPPYLQERMANFKSPCDD